MATGAKVTGAVTRWWWVRHAPVPNPERRCYGQSDKDCDVSNEALFRHQAALLPKGAVWYSSNLLRARKTAEIIRLASLTFSFLFLLAVVWWGVPEVLDSQKYNTRTESLLLPLAPFLWTLLIGFTFMAIQMFFQVYRDIQKMRGRTVLEEPREDDSKMLLH